MDTTQPTYELTRNPADGSWGFICREHGLHRYGLTEPHAINVERKHIREDHATTETSLNLDLSAAAASFLHYNDAGSASVWHALTGLRGMDAVILASNLANREPAVRAAVVPF